MSARYRGWDLWSGIAFVLIACGGSTNDGGIVQDDTGAGGRTRPDPMPHPRDDCGNGVIDEGELCDGSALGDATCTTVTRGQRTDGTLSCTELCAFDASECVEGPPTGGAGGAGGTSGGGGTAGGIGCSNNCVFANDGFCDEPDLCAVGTDCTDCTGTGGVAGAGGASGCDTCVYANDGFCDEPSFCSVGTDCTDCGTGGAAGAGGAGGTTSGYTCIDSQPYPIPAVAPVPTAECGQFDVADPFLGYCISATEAASIVSSTGALDVIPQDTCASGELCMPKSKVDSMGSCFDTCTTVFADAGACVPTYVVEASDAGAGLSALFGTVTCATGETCASCVSPLDGTITGFCDN